MLQTENEHGTFYACVCELIPTIAESPNPAAWRWAGYRLAYRYQYGVDRGREMIPHNLCVLTAVRSYVRGYFSRTTPPSDQQQDEETDTHNVDEEEKKNER